jgi:hypothetical protein
MSPWSCVDLLASDIHNWVSRAAHADREQGRTIPESTYMDRLAGKLGVVRRQLYRYMSGEAMPSWDQIGIICNTVEAARAVEQLCRDVGLIAIRRIAHGAATVRDVVGLVATQLREAAEAGQEALRVCADNQVSIDEYRAVERQVLKAQDALTALLSTVRAKMEETLRR